MRAPDARLNAQLATSMPATAQINLYMKLAADPRNLGDPTPAQGAPLSAAGRDLSQTRIHQGAR